MAVRDDPLGPLIVNLQQHAHLSPADTAALRRLPVSVRVVEAGSYVVREGDRPVDCSLLLTGFACRHKVTMNGDRQIISIQVAGDALDLQHLFLDIADHNVQTLVRADVAFVSREAVKECALDRPGIARAVAIRSAVEASVFREWVVNVGRRDGRSRIAHLLCEFATKMDLQGLASDGAYSLPMTQEQIGDATGMTSVHVNRLLRGLEEEGLLVRHGRSIAFPDIVALREIADFNTRYLHLGKQEMSRV